MFRSSKKYAEGNAGKQGTMLCRNPQCLYLVPYALYRELEISMAAHRYKDIKNWSQLIRNILKILTTKIQGAGKVESSTFLLAIFDFLLVL